MDRIKVERAIAGLTEWQKHVQADSDIDRDISTAIEALKAQLSQEGETPDLIDRQQALDIFDDYNVSVENGELEAYSRDRKRLCELQSVQPVATDTNVGDTISKFIDGLEEIFADLRERHVDDSVCGLCEYDGAYMGQSGDWCNECPGFDRDDCFKLSDETRKKWTDEIIKALPPAQPEQKPCKWIYGENEYGVDGYHCDECGFFVPWDYAHKSINFIEDYNYCPYCGADMRGEKDG